MFILQIKLVISVVLISRPQFKILIVILSKITEWEGIELIRFPYIFNFGFESASTDLINERHRKDAVETERGMVS